MSITSKKKFYRYGSNVKLITLISKIMSLYRTYFFLNYFYYICVYRTCINNAPDDYLIKDGHIKLAT